MTERGLLETMHETIEELAGTVDSLTKTVESLQTRLHEHITVKSPWNLKIEDQIAELQNRLDRAEDPSYP